MSNYKEQTAVATAWQRAYQVVINNKLNQVPNITFYEEEAINLPSGSVTKPISHITESFINPLQEFPLLNPETGDVIGIAKYMDAYILIHSMYMYLVDRRDNPPVIPYVEPEPYIPPPDEEQPPV